MDEKTAPIGGQRPSTGAATVPEVRYGNAVVRRPLGRGGMGEVYLAFHEGFQTPVCVKLLPETFTDTEMVDRFLREAQVAVRLDHPNIVRVHDVGRANGRVYMIMEYVEGQDLEAYANDHGGHLPLAEALRLAAEAARGIAYAHAQGVIHRDIKPANLVRRAKDGVVKVLDFGLARAAGMDQLTNDQRAMGTLPYMAYEQLLGQAGPPSDVYALGVALYRLLAGRLPFMGALDELLAYHREGSPTPLASFRPTPERVQALVSRMMAKDPGERPTAEAASAEMEAIRQGLGTDGARPATDGLARLAGEMRGAPAAGNADPTMTPGGRKRRPWAAAVLLVVALLAGAEGARRAGWFSRAGKFVPTPAPQAPQVEAGMAVLVRPQGDRGFETEAMKTGLPETRGMGIHANEGLRFAVKSERPLHVYVFNVDPEGKTVCLFPNHYERLCAKETDLVGGPVRNPLRPIEGAIVVPPMVTHAGGRREAWWYKADQQVGKEWFLVAAAPSAIAELETLRKRADLADCASDVKAFGARQRTTLRAPDAGAPALMLGVFASERTVEPLSIASGEGLVVWTVTLDHQR